MSTTQADLTIVLNNLSSWSVNIYEPFIHAFSKPTSAASDVLLLVLNSHETTDCRFVWPHTWPSIICWFQARTTFEKLSRMTLHSAHLLSPECFSFGFWTGIWSSSINFVIDHLIYTSESIYGSQVTNNNCALMYSLFSSSEYGGRHDHPIYFRVHRS